MVGTERYISRTAQKGFDQSRRDDLEAITNLICFFLRGGDLPWVAS
jgi:hypothetical protein